MLRLSSATTTVHHRGHSSSPFLPAVPHMADGASNKACLASSTCQGETQQARSHLHLRQKLSADAFSMATVATAQSMSTLLLRGIAMFWHLWTPPPDCHRQVYTRQWHTATPTAERSSLVPKASAAYQTDRRRPRSKQPTFPARMDRVKQCGQSEVHTVPLHGRNTVNCWCTAHAKSKHRTSSSEVFQTCKRKSWHSTPKDKRRQTH